MWFFFSAAGFDYVGLGYCRGSAGKDAKVHGKVIDNKDYEYCRDNCRNNSNCAG